MSAVDTRDASASPRATGPALSFSGVLRSEWIKLLSLRSTVWSYGLIIVLWVGFGLLVAWTFSFGTDNAPGSAAPPPPPPGLAAEITLTVSTLGVASIGQLIAAVLGVLVISGEYSTGMIRSTLAAVPRRLTVLAAKAIVLFVTTTLVGLVSAAITYLVTYPILDGQGLASGLDEPGLAIALLGSALYLGLVAVFALGLGTLIRASAGGIAAALGVLLMLPILISVLSAFVDWAEEIQPFLLSNAGAVLYSIHADADVGMGMAWESTQLDPLPAALVVLGWTIGALALRRRDA